MFSTSRNYSHLNKKNHLKIKCSVIDIIFERFFKFFAHFTRIVATNNSRKYNGTTYIAADDPQVQHFHISDWPQRQGVYEVKFSKHELDSSDTFCKGFTATVSGKLFHK